MKFSQRKFRYLTRLMLLAALATQSILAAHACIEVDASAANALAMEAKQLSMPCHESAKLNANECLMHCTASDQLSQDAHTPVAVPVENIVLRVALPQLKHLVHVSNQSPLALNTGPPRSILFCSFLI